MCHNLGVQSAEIVRAIRAKDMTQEQLARRAGIARETLSRWESGAQHPSLESLGRLARAVGQPLEVQVLPAEPKLVEQVHAQLGLSPTKRLRVLLGNAWPSCRDAPVRGQCHRRPRSSRRPGRRCASGAPQRPSDGRVDLLVPQKDIGRAFDCLMAVGTWPDGFEWASEGGERRERWRAGRGALTVRSTAAGVEDIVALRDRARPIAMNRSGRELGVVAVPLPEDLAELMSFSPWGQDAVYRAGLRAVLACGRSFPHEHDEQPSKTA
jgi:transcriptional regulator with XRE-family HTH domain